MNLLIAAAISFLPFFETRNSQVLSSVAELVGEEALGEDFGDFAEPQPAKSGQAAGAAGKADFPDLKCVERCPVCEGRGKFVLREQDFGQRADGRIGARDFRTLPCALCKGKGRLPGYRRVRELLLAVAADRRRFEAAHLARGEIKVGEAFVPAAEYALMDKDRRKLVERTFGEPCPACLWTGLAECKKCDGTGKIECPNRNCKGGWSVTKAKRGKKRSLSSSVVVEVCEECGGCAFVRCPTCSGERATPCRKCAGMGEKKKGR